MDQFARLRKVRIAQTPIDVHRPFDRHDFEHVLGLVAVAQKLLPLRIGSIPVIDDAVAQFDGRGYRPSVRILGGVVAHYREA